MFSWSHPSWASEYQCYKEMLYLSLILRQVEHPQLLSTSKVVANAQHLPGSDPLNSSWLESMELEKFIPGEDLPHYPLILHLIICFTAMRLYPDDPITRAQVLRMLNNDTALLTCHEKTLTVGFVAHEH